MHPEEMSSPRSVMSFSSACAEPGSRQPSPEGGLEPMDCDDVDNVSGMNFEDSFRLDPQGGAHHYSEFGMDYSALRRQHWFSSVDAPCSELDGDFHFLDADFGDLPPLLEPAYIPSVISSFFEGAVGKEKGKEDNVENESGEGRALEKGKGRAKGKGKARVGPYPRERPHLRADWQPLFAGSFLMNTASCSNITTSDMLAEFRNHPLLFSENHFPGDPSGCGVPHHDDN